MPENGVMKKKDLFRFRDGLNAVGDYKGIKFAYAVASLNIDQGSHSRLIS